jgi:hypothetical protein
VTFFRGKGKKKKKPKKETRTVMHQHLPVASKFIDLFFVLQVPFIRIPPAAPAREVAAGMPQDASAVVLFSCVVLYIAGRGLPDAKSDKH